jgi:hypothetical protein
MEKNKVLKIMPCLFNLKLKKKDKGITLRVFK